MTTDWRALCAELLSEFDYYSDWSDAEEVKERARASLPEPEPEGPKPQPVPVAERLPGPEDCDAEGRCWWFCFECPGEHSYWILAKEVYCDPALWLPAHALPLPS